MTRAIAENIPPVVMAEAVPTIVAAIQESLPQTLTRAESQAVEEAVLQGLTATLTKVEVKAVEEALVGTIPSDMPAADIEATVAAVSAALPDTLTNVEVKAIEETLTTTLTQPVATPTLAPTPAPTPPRGGVRLPPPIRFPSSSREGEPYPRVVEWPQGGSIVRKDLVDGSTRFRKNTGDITQRPWDGFKVVAKSATPPKRQRLDLGAVDVLVSPSGLRFVTSMDNRTLPVPRPRPLLRKRGRTLA